MAIDATVKKWGNSFGIILPRDLIEKQCIRENDVIYVQIVKKADLTKDFGMIKRKMSGQEFKDMVRAGWER
jgi:antitoxin component of MazEF toxin-antitoxin module